MTVLLLVTTLALAEPEEPAAAEVAEVTEAAPPPDAEVAELAPAGPEWVLRGSGAYHTEGRRVLRGVGVARGHRFLMDARKVARPLAVAELEAAVRRLGSDLTIAYGKTASGEGDANVMSEIAGLADAFIAYRQRLLDEIDDEHMVWQGRDDDAYWAMAELELSDVQEYVETYADVGPFTRGWVVEHLGEVFDSGVPSD